MYIYALLGVTKGPLLVVAHKIFDWETTKIINL